MFHGAAESFSLLIEGVTRQLSIMGDPLQAMDFNYASLDFMGRPRHYMLSANVRLLSVVAGCCRLLNQGCLLLLSLRNVLHKGIHDRIDEFPVIDVSIYFLNLHHAPTIKG